MIAKPTAIPTATVLSTRMMPAKTNTPLPSPTFTPTYEPTPAVITFDDLCKTDSPIRILGELDVPS